MIPKTVSNKKVNTGNFLLKKEDGIRLTSDLTAACLWVGAKKMRRKIYHN